MNDYKELLGRLRALADFVGYEKESCVCLAVDAIKQLVKERKELKEVNLLLKANCDHFKRERDAAIADLHKIADCRTCGNLTSFCSENPDYCKGYVWRGMQEVEHETD